MMRAVDDAADDCDMIEGPARDFCTGDSGGDGEECGAGTGDDPYRTCVCEYDDEDQEQEVVLA
ncbi:hypothetical protein EBN88_14180 [Streptomyces triticirhizae]|uniref:Uncharacterized protein n=2 Tax=Streptomyces triticirhizae TaxID=2483353 RepID=A0A3M2LUP9_9ACTN|nr:hypothetical protein EBN88_14180 [Streptomyces triticirhizae]